MDCLRIRLPVNRPAGSTAPVDVDLGAAILARPSFFYEADGDTVVSVNVSGTLKLLSWPSRGGNGRSYSASDSDKRPTLHLDGGLNDLPWVEFDGDPTTGLGDRLGPSWAASDIPATANHTVIDVCRLDALSGTRYFDGTISGTDSRAGTHGAGGNIAQQYGEAVASVPGAAAVWNVVTRSMSSTGAVEIHSGGSRATAQAVSLPTTARAYSLGASGGLANAGVWDGGWAYRLILLEYIGADRAWFRDVVGERLKRKFGLATNPIITP